LVDEHLAPALQDADPRRSRSPSSPSIRTTDYGHSSRSAGAAEATQRIGLGRPAAAPPATDRRRVDRRIPALGRTLARTTNEGRAAMSELQYYEFSGGRPAAFERRSEDGVGAPSSSQRALNPTSTGFFRTTTSGADLKADSDFRLVEPLIFRPFFRLYRPTWRSAAAFAMRLPAKLVDLAALEPFQLDEDVATHPHHRPSTIIVDIGLEEIDGHRTPRTTAASLARGAGPPLQGRICSRGDPAVLLSLLAGLA